MLLATVFPLVLRKGFGRIAGVTALVLNLALLGGLLLIAATGLLRTLFPVMIALGPLTVLQYTY